MSYHVLWVWAAFVALFGSVSAANSTSFGSIGTSTYGPGNSVLRTSIYNPPINLCDQDFIEDFISFLSSLNSTLDSNGDPAVKVVIIASAMPTYFIEHFDIRLFQAPGPVNNYVNGTEVLQRYWKILDLLNGLPQLFIAEVVMTCSAP
jgi:enoyl-CoA hydratase/carnithine racemase